MENEGQNNPNERKDDEKSQDKRLEEIKKLLDQAKQNPEGKQGSLFPDEELGSEDVGFDASILSDTADPDKSYALYYSMRKMLMDNLPSGKKNKKLRQTVYDEKNLFLNRGKALDARGKRGSDGRMSFISTFMEPAFNAVADWVKTGGSPFDAFMAFYDLNEAYGFHKSEEKDASDGNDSPNQNPGNDDDSEGGVLEEV
ncbi:hypothetical protein [Spirosoma litoris]